MQFWSAPKSLNILEVTELTSHAHLAECVTTRQIERNDVKAEMS